MAKMLLGTCNSSDGYFEAEADSDTKTEKSQAKKKKSKKPNLRRFHMGVFYKLSSVKKQRSGAKIENSDQNTIHDVSDEKKGKILKKKNKKLNMRNINKKVLKNRQMKKKLISKKHQYGKDLKS